MAAVGHVGQGDEIRGMSVEHSGVCRTLLHEVLVQPKMGGELRGRPEVETVEAAPQYLVAGAGVIEPEQDAVVFGIAREVTEAAAASSHQKNPSGQGRARRVQLLTAQPPEGGSCASHGSGHVDGEISSVALGPPTIQR